MSRKLAMPGLVPVLALMMAGCGKQPAAPHSAAANPPSSAVQPSAPVQPEPGQPPAVQPVAQVQAQPQGRPVEGGPGLQPVAPNAATPAYPVPLPTAAPPRPYPVVSAEPAEPPSGVHRVRKPSAFAPRERPVAQRVAVTESRREESIVIPAGTRIRVRLAETVDTRHTPPGARFAATLDEPIVEGNRVIVPRGTPFEGTVVESKSSGRFRGRALIAITLNSFRLHGTTYRIATVPDARVSGSHKTRNLAYMGGGPAAGAGIGALAGGGPEALIGAGVGAVAGTTTAFITGKKNVKIPVETPLVFSLRSHVQIRRV